MNNQRGGYGEHTTQIAAILKKHRKAQGYTAIYVATGIGVSRTTLSKFENNMVGLGLENFLKYVDFLGLDIGDLAKSPSLKAKNYKKAFNQITCIIDELKSDKEKANPLYKR